MKNGFLTIGIVCYPSIGGSGIVATNLGERLAQSGHEVHFISYEKPFRLKRDSANPHFHKVAINQYDLFKHPDYALPLAVTMVTTHQQYQFDILHVHYAVPHATAALLARQILLENKIEPPKIITTLHGTDITLFAHDKSLYPIIKYSIEESDGITAVSQYLKEETERTLKIHKPIQVIHNFFDPPAVTKSREETRKSLGLAPDDFVAIHISNLRPVKRIPFLLEIVAALKQEPSLKLLILAGAKFEPFLPLVKELGIENKIMVRERVHDVHNYIAASDMGLYVSETESFGMGILETMSYGLPVIAPDAGGIPEVMENETNGYLLASGSSAEFADKIRFLMHHREVGRKLGENAARRARVTFSGQSLIPKYLDYYLNIATQSNEESPQYAAWSQHRR
jgi:N-acetyl-alpha-D-glucosaminyl L-malate synthase BshA